MALYIIAITGNDVIRNRKMADYIQSCLDESYKQFYKTPNYRKYLTCVIDPFHSALDSTVMKIHDLSFRRKIGINKQTLYSQLKMLGDGVLWDNIMIAKLEEYKEAARKKPHYDFYVIIPDVTTENQVNALREYDTTFIFNFDTEAPATKYELFSYKMLNWKRKINTGVTHLEYLYRVGIDLWYFNNKPDFYMKEYCANLVTTLNKTRIYQNKLV